MRWRGKQWDALTDTTHALNVEGALRSGKTTIALWKELQRAASTHPGLHTLLARWTEDATQSVLKPIWRGILSAGGPPRPLEPARALRRVPEWRARLHPRPQGAGRADALRQVPRPDPRPRLHRPGRGGAARHLPRAQGAAVAEGLPAPDRHHAAGGGRDALDREGVSGRQQRSRIGATFRSSVYDNAHNLDAETIRNLEETYPLGHPKRQTLIDGPPRHERHRRPGLRGRVQPAAARAAARVHADAPARGGDRLRQASSVLGGAAGRSVRRAARSWAACRARTSSSMTSCASSRATARSGSPA